MIRGALWELAKLCAPQIIGCTVSGVCGAVIVWTWIL